MNTLANTRPAEPTPSTPVTPDMRRVYVVDDDRDVRSGLLLLLETEGYAVCCHDSATNFLATLDDQLPELTGCLILDIRMPDMDGMELQRRLSEVGCALPIVFLTGHGQMPDAITALRGGALDFLLKPVNGAELLECVAQAWHSEADRLHIRALRQAEQAGLAQLSGRELEVLAYAVQGHNNPDIAAALGISHRTIEAHRSRLLLKLNAPSVQAWLRRCEAAAYSSSDVAALLVALPDGKEIATK